MGYVPFMPGSDQPKPNREQRRAWVQQRARQRRRTYRATVRAIKEAAAEEAKGITLTDGANGEDTTTVTVDLESGTVR